MYARINYFSYKKQRKTSPFFKMNHFESPDNVKKIQPFRFQSFRGLSYFARTRPSDFILIKLAFLKAQNTLFVHFFHSSAHSFIPCSNYTFSPIPSYCNNLFLLMPQTKKQVDRCRHLRFMI